MGDVATKKLLENDRMIVWELLLEPGETTGMHTHEHDYLIQVIEGSTLKAIDAEGNESEVPLPDDGTYFFTVENGIATSGKMQTTTLHEAVNVGPGRYREIMVEFLK